MPTARGQPVRLDGAAFAQLVNDAGYGYAIYRDLLAAGRAYEAGDPAPLLRLAAEDLTSVDAGGPASYSEGAYAAVACHDYPTLWNPAVELAERRAELRAARAQLAPDAFAPFPADLWLDSLYEHQLVYGCLRWPAPAVPDPPAPAGATYPAVPVLVLNGDLDVITPLADAARAAALFPNATNVTVATQVHVTALADFDRCATGIVRRFLRTLAPGDTSCAAGAPSCTWCGGSRAAPPAPGTAVPRAGDRSRPLDRRAAWVAAQAVADAISRWWLMYGRDGHGLRGGALRRARRLLRLRAGPLPLARPAVRRATSRSAAARRGTGGRSASARACGSPACAAGRCGSGGRPAGADAHGDDRAARSAAARSGCGCPRR